MFEEKKEMKKYSTETGTNTKLELYSLYLKEAIPVFLNSKHFDEVQICDFFAGDGSENGSAKIALDIINSIDNKDSKKIKLILNDSDPEYAFKLQKRIATENPNVEIEFHNEGFETLWPKMRKRFEKSYKIGRILFLDQHGMKVINKNNFHQFIIKGTDLLFFISSSNIKRFSNHPNFNIYIEANKIAFDKDKPTECHRRVFEYFKSLIPSGTKFYMAPFSIMKESKNNINGLIFGSTHELGCEKFINMCWNIDKTIGEANHNMDNEPSYSTGGSIPLFELPPAKLVNFEDELKTRIISKEIETNKQAYSFALDRGCKFSHVNQAIKKLKKEYPNLNFGGTISSNLHRLKEQKITF